VYVQPPQVGKHFDQGEAYGEIESVKAVSDLYCPVAGEIAGVNEELDQNPVVVNEDPYGRGWIARIRADNVDALSSLLDAAAYEESTRERH
jgi:glycine cleavage system H protein